jgi:hypothetical protein
MMRIMMRDTAFGGPKTDLSRPPRGGPQRRQSAQSRTSLFLCASAVKSPLVAARRAALCEKETINNHSESEI